MLKAKGKLAYNKNYDVIVIGGGSAGSQTAYSLALKRKSVLVLEKKYDIAEPVCCTGIVSLECVRNFAISEVIILHKINGARFFLPSGKSHLLERKEPVACVLDHSALNRFLADRASKAGAEYIVGTIVQEVKSESNGVTVKVSLRGESKSLTAKAAVLANGASSVLTENCGFGKIPDWAAGAQAEVEVTGDVGVEIYTGKNITPGFFAWLVATKPGKALAGLICRKNTQANLEKFLEMLENKEKIVSADVEHQFRKIPLSFRDCTQLDNLLLVGDAAGHNKPTTGGGIYWGLICADVAANYLTATLGNRGTLNSRSQKKYETAWREKLEAEILTGKYVRKLYEKLGDDKIDNIFNLAMSTGLIKKILYADDFSFDWHSRSVAKILNNNVILRIVDSLIN